MVFEVFVQHLFSYVSDAPRTIANGPQMTAPIALFQLRIVLKQFAGTSTLETLGYCADGHFRGVTDMKMDVIFAHNSF